MVRAVSDPQAYCSMSEHQQSGSRIPVLCWHQVAPGVIPQVTRVSPKCFQQQIEAVLRAGWTPLDPGEYLQRDGRAVPGEKSCLLCFDDAYRGVWEHAYPLLHAEGLRAVIFVPVNLVGDTNAWDPGVPGTKWQHADWQQLRALQEAGWEIGLHGASHRPLKGLSASVLQVELVQAGEKLEKQLGQSPRLLAWPFGLQDAKGCRLAATAGIRLAFGRSTTVHSLVLPRLMVYPWHSARCVTTMLQRNRPGPLQRLAARGARLSAHVMQRSLLA